MITSGAFISQAAILPLFVAHHTDDRLVLGLITATALLCGALPQLLGAALTARSPSLWRAFCWQSVLPRLVLMALCATPFLPGPWALVAFFAIYALYQAALGLNAPVWFEFVSHVIPAGQRGRFYGLRSTLGGVASVAALALASWLLAALPAPWSFAACFTLAAILLAVSLGCMLATRHDWAPIDAERRRAPPFSEAAAALLRDHDNFRRYLFARLVLSGSAMGTAFYVIYGMERFHLSIGASSLLAIALVYLPSMAGLLWGRLADEWGNKPLQVPASLAAGLACLAMLAWPSLPVYALCLFVIGCATVIVNIADAKWLIELDRERCATVVGFFNLALMPAAVLSSLAAGAIAQAFGMPAVFLMTAVAYVAGGALLAVLVDEPRPVPQASLEPAA